ncbi:serine protease FAM111A-like [Gadus chalcogrammus]|uniref:serine protease FAM111A-like n=1 Tax=Gadus chalcogrammus TaxID=1042646 RepID=UPI0024C4D034|nr:serine protease FAM111A-like [Gadus chalcogrammus]
MCRLLLRSQFPYLTKSLKGRQKDANIRDVRKLFSREFGKHVGICKEIRILRKLVELGDSVCQVKITNIRDVRKLFSREFGKHVGICKEIRILRKLVELGDSVCQVKITNIRDVRKLFSREFGKHVGICKEIRSFRKLVELGDSVCQVKINGGAAGSGFLLFGKYILTNAHVVLDEEKINLKENISVVFFYEDKVENPCLPLLVTVVAWRYHVDKEGYKQDWALLGVDNNQNTLTMIIQPLLQHFGPVTESGHICIIGHPEGKVKMWDPCFTIPRDECEKRIKPDYLFRDIQTYDSCFYEGSSGSPVFDHNFKVVSMHTGGFPDKNTEHAFEYAHPLSLIIEEILMDIVRHRKLDVLLAMITCGIPKEVKAAVIEKVLRYFDKSFVCTENDLIELANSSYCKAEQKHLKDFFLDFNPWIPRDLV